MELSTDSQYPPTLITKVPKYAELRKRFFVGDNQQYMMIYSISCSEEKTTFKIQLMSPGEQHPTQFTKLESELELSASDFKKIMCHISYRDAMPLTLNVKRIRNIYTLLQYFLLPFTGIIFLEDGKKEIAVYPKARDLLHESYDMLTVPFMNKDCVVTFIHITRNTFRILIVDSEDFETEAKIDVDFDDITLQHCFAKHGVVDDPLGTVKNTIGILDGADNEFMTSSMPSVYLPSKDGEELASFKLICNQFVEDIKNAVGDIAAYFNTLGIHNMDQFSQNNDIIYCKLKLSNQMQKTLYVVWDRPEKQLLEVKVKNFFETFAPNNKKVKACGEFTFVYDAVWKHFERKYTELEYSDKLAICSLISEGFSLKVYDKSNFIFEFAGLICLELTKEDEKKYKENFIICHLK